MSQATKKREEDIPAISNHMIRGLREGGLIILLAIAIFLLISLLSYNPSDPAWSYSGPQEQIQNAGGFIGAWFSDIFLYIFGYMAFMFPALVAYAAVVLHRGDLNLEDNGKAIAHVPLRFVGFLLTITAGGGLSAMHFQNPVLAMPMHAGGVLGQVTAEGVLSGFSYLGGTLLLLALFFTGISLFTGLSWLKLMDETGRVTLSLMSKAHQRIYLARENWIGNKARKAREETVKVEKKKKTGRKPPRIEPTIKPVIKSERVEREKQSTLFVAERGEVPPLSLLDIARENDKGYSTEALEAMSRLVELKLRDFGIEVTVEAVHPGPVITRFEMMPAAGIKVSQIVNLNKDLARALSVTSVRVVEVIPGKSVIGLEIPNENREIVVLSEILGSLNYDRSDSVLTLALGKDIGGNPVVADLMKMPHLLVAGTTGSGKSVAINAMLLSLLYKSTAEEVRLIMIDPKMLELSVYDGIPHLLSPVVTDMKDAANALRWCVAEMDRRYRLMAALGVRNIGGYNRKVKVAADKGQPILDPLFKQAESMDETASELTALPFVVVVVDELADLMMVAGKKVEELIARLAQKARASGIHLVLATQRPSVDVITGLIKANIPTRIAFQVSSKVDSRTILDQMGAETLLGHGDMLYLPPGTAIPTRIHGAFVSDHEVHQVVKHLKSQGAPEYLDEVISGTFETQSSDPLLQSSADSSSESDPLYDQAVRIVTETRKASVSGIQRRLKVGYNRAARMVEEMELTGVVGPLQSNGSREVLAPPPVDV